MSSESNKTLSEQALAPLNFIYACSICGASFADVYKSPNDTVQGLSDGINPKERLVTRLFLASCCHVICAEHVDGGNPSFHPVGERPKSACRVCIKEKNEHEPRDLYSIRGFTKDEYDPHIPAAWFTAPPIRLDGNGKEMDALRFQYLALIRYCQNACANQKTLQNALSESEKIKADMQELASEKHAKLLNLQQQHEQLFSDQEQLKSMRAEAHRLQELEEQLEHYRRLSVNPRDLETFVNNKSAIRHYLKLVPMLIEQNEKMKKRLASLGFAMALEPVPNFKDIDPHVFDSDEAVPESHMGERRGMLRKTNSSPTAGRSAHNSGIATTLPSSPFSSRPVKRQRVESPMHSNIQLDPPNSRDIMPPPPKPPSRMQSVRKIFPSWRKKFSNGRSTPIPTDSFQKNGVVQKHDTTGGQDSSRDRPPTRYGVRSDPPLMSGAIPAQPLTPDSKVRGSQLLSSVGMNDSDSNFTFRAPSPLQMNKPSKSHLPIEPSYIRLMDGLSHDTDLELGLKDPREATTEGYYNASPNEQKEGMYQEQEQEREQSSPTRWSFGHPFLHQAPSGPPSLANVQLDPPRFSPIDNSAIRTDIPTCGLLTPAYDRHQKPGYPAESVVSPFFERSHHQAPLHARTGFAERQDSSRRFETCRSNSFSMNENQGSWRQQPSLNGLSFFDSPVNSLNQPIQYTHGRHAVEPLLPSRHYRNSQSDSGSYVLQPDAMLSSGGCMSGYDFSYNTSPQSRRSAAHFRSTYAVPSLQRSSYTRSYRLPSTMPSAVPNHFPDLQKRWDTLRRVGVRSSRHVFNSNRLGTENTRYYNHGRHNTRR